MTNDVIEHTSFAACAADTSMQHMQHSVEAALEQLLRTGPLYKKVGAAAYCLAFLRKSDFPKEIAADVAVLFSVRQYVQYLGHGEYRDYSEIPRPIQREWVSALLRIYRLLMIAKGAESAVWSSQQRHEIPMSQAARIERIDEACRQNIRCITR